MGAISFLLEVEDYSAKEAFNTLVSEASYEYGENSYNGSISTCSIGSCKLKLNGINKTNKKKAEGFIEKEGNGQKYVADYVDLGVISYDAIETKRLPIEKIDVKKKKPYSVVISDYRTVRTLKEFDTITEAHAYASIVALQYEGGIKIIKSRKDLEVLYEYHTKTSSYKTKPKLKNLPNREVKEKHLYYFYGWASC